MNKHKDKRRILFYAPVGNRIAGFQNGGAEAGCRKTMEILSKDGFDLILLEKPVKTRFSSFATAGLAIDLIKTWFRFIQIIRNNDNIVVHIAGFYLSHVYFEWLLVQTAGLLNAKTIYEIRNGGMIEAYNERSSTYKFFMKSILKDATEILCQGADYLPFIKRLVSRGSIYYPNYLMDDFVTSNDTARDSETTVKLIYFGRVVPDKNIDFIIQVCRQLNSLNVKCALDIIGGYEESYHQELTSSIGKYNLTGDVIFHGRMDFALIYQQLKTAHFFIFPSKEKREGHSNALTEAMGCGVVPIVSTAGFNASIVGNPELVMPEFNSHLYAQKIKQIWLEKRWHNLSDSVHQRIINNYTESIVKHALLGAYVKLDTDKI